MSLQQWPTDLLRDFSNSNRRTEMDPTRMDIDSRTMARSHRFLKDDWHFSWCWPWVPLSIFMPAAACFVHGRVTRDDISGETYHGYPRPFRGIKSRISKERQKDLPVVVNFMQISGFPWIRQLSPPHRWDPKESRIVYPFVKSCVHHLLYVIYSYAINNSSNRLFLFLYG